MPLFVEPDALDRHLQNIASDVREIEKFVLEVHARLFNNVWHSPDFTAAEVLARIGTDAAKLFASSQKIQEALASFDPAYVPLVPPLPYALNADGSVTLVEPPQEGG